MKKTQRAPWLAALGDNNVLCQVCRHRDWYLDDMVCMHPLDAVGDSWWNYGIEPGNDCWGFRPGKGTTLESTAAWAAAGGGDDE